MSSLDDEDRFGPVDAPQLTASGLGLFGLSAVIGFVEARVHSGYYTEGYNAWSRGGRGLELANADEGGALLQRGGLPVFLETHSASGPPAAEGVSASGEKS